MVGDTYVLLTKIEDASRRVLWEVAAGALHGLVPDNGRRFLVTKRSLHPGGWTKIESEPGLGTNVEFWMPVT